MKKIWMLIAALEEMTLLLAGCGTAGREEKRMSPEAAVESAEDENEESSVKESIETEEEESSA